MVDQGKESVGASLGKAGASVKEGVVGSLTKTCPAAPRKQA